MKTYYKNKITTSIVFVVMLMFGFNTKAIANTNNATQNSTQAMNTILKGFVDNTVYGLPGNILANLTATFIINLFSSPADPNQNVLDKLSGMDQKLDNIAADLQTNLKISQDSLNAINKLAVDSNNQNFDDLYREVTNKTQTIALKYKGIDGLNGFGDSSNTISTSKLSELYSYVVNKWDNKKFSATLLQYLDIDTTKIGNTSYDLLLTNKDNFETGATSQSLYSSFANIRKSFIVNITGDSITSGNPLTDYIDGYNIDMLRTRTNIIKSFQELYNIQVMQLAIYYASKGSVTIPQVVKDPLPQDFTVQGFINAVKLLDKEYATIYTNLNNNFTKYINFVDNKEFYSIINQTLFKNNAILSTDFANNINTDKTSAKSCGVSLFQVTKLNNAVSKMDLGATCYINGLKESANFVGLVTTTGSQIEKFTSLNISYDATKKELISDHNGSYNTELSEIQKVVEDNTDLKGKSIRDEQFMQRIGYSYVTLENIYRSNWWISDIVYQIESGDNADFYPVRFKDKENGQNLYGKFDNLSRFDLWTPYKRLWNAWGTSKDNYNVCSEFWGMSYYYLGHYKNDWFALKLNVGYRDCSNFERGAAVVGIACINGDTTCKRDTANDKNIIFNNKVMLYISRPYRDGDGWDTDYKSSNKPKSIPSVTLNVGTTSTK